MAESSYILMHKRTPVADLQIDTPTGTISAVGRVHAAEHVPVGIPVKKGMIDRAALNAWWKGRAIPASRSGIQHALHELQVPATEILLEKCLGLSLSDQYWICPADSPVTWDDINFFTHPFSDDVGNILFGQGSTSDRISLMSPDNTSDGWLKKRWTILDGKRCLIKGGSGATQQEPYNEVIASAIMERLGVPHVTYTLLYQEDYPYSVCEDFITAETELIPAWYVMQTRKKENHVSVHQHYINCCEELGVPNIREAIDQMLVVDYLLVNEDRHQSNFGVVRSADTLAFLGAAPIFDSGTSLWFDKPLSLIGNTAHLTCKPFKVSHEEQVKLTSSFAWLDLSKLDGIEDEWMELTRGSLFLDERRRAAIAQALRERITRLGQIAHSGTLASSGVAGDVAEDTHYSGTPSNSNGG